MEARSPRAGEVTVRHLEPELCATIRFTGAYRDVGERFGDLMQRAGDLVAGPAAALYWQSEYRENDAEISVALPIARPAERSGIEVMLLQVTDAVATVYKGPHEEIGVAYERALSDVARRSASIELPIRERYLRGPDDAGSLDPDEYLTEILIPITADSASPDNRAQ